MHVHNATNSDTSRVFHLRQYVKLNHRYYNLRTRDPGLEMGSRAPMTTIELLACTPRCNFADRT